MDKKKFKQKYLDDFEKMRGALLAQIKNNQKLDEEIISRFAEEDYTLLEEHAQLSKIILDSTKVLSDAYKLAPQILDDIEETKEEPKKLDINKIMDELSDDED